MEGLGEGDGQDSSSLDTFFSRRPDAPSTETPAAAPAAAAPAGADAAAGGVIDPEETVIESK